MSKSKIVLDLCGGTGAWSRPYAEVGYDVRSITLPDYDVRTYMPLDDVYGILAAPPCTMFSLARQNAKTKRDFDVGMELVESCLNIIWRCHPTFWCLENPRGYLRQFLGKPAMTFKPCEFGDPWAKVTDLWGYFKEPKRLKKPVDIIRGQHRASRQHDLPGDRPKQRAITPPGFAQAFFEANR